jgi:hypothetical protein
MAEMGSDQKERSVARRGGQVLGAAHVDDAATVRPPQHGRKVRVGRQHAPEMSPDLLLQSQPLGLRHLGEGDREVAAHRSRMLVREARTDEAGEGPARPGGRAPRQHSDQRQHEDEGHCLERPNEGPPQPIFARARLSSVRHGPDVS